MSVPAHTGDVFGAGRRWDSFWQWVQSGAEADTGVLQPNAARGTFSLAGSAEVRGTLALPVAPHQHFLTLAVHLKLCGAPTCMSFQQGSCAVTQVTPAAPLSNRWLSLFPSTNYQVHHLSGVCALVLSD